MESHGVQLAKSQLGTESKGRNKGLERNDLQCGILTAPCSRWSSPGSAAPSKILVVGSSVFDRDSKRISFVWYAIHDGGEARQIFCTGALRRGRSSLK